MISKDYVEIAQYHYYLTQAILDRLPESFGSIGNIFGYGEDSFVFELYSLSEQWYVFDDKLFKEGKRPDNLIVLYEVPDEIAKFFWDYVLKSLSIKMPDRFEFNLILVKTMNIFATKRKGLKGVKGRVFHKGKALSYKGKGN